MVGKARLSALAVSLLASTFAWAGPSAEQTLRMVLRRSTTIAFEQVQFLYSPNPAHKPIQMKVESEGRGRWKHTILQPLVLARTVSVDDGRTWTTYTHDRRTITKTDSPRLTGREVDQRIALVRENYNLEISSGESVAEHKTYLVVATPKSKEMPTRRMWVDRETNILLRSSQVLNGRTTRLLDTVVFRSGDDADPDTSIEFDTDDWQVFSDRLGRAISTPKEAYGTMGRTLVLPRQLPLGFSPVKMIVIEDSDMPVVSVRLSDGLSTATLYWFRPRSQGETFTLAYGNSSSRIAEGMMYQVISDLPVNVNARLLESILKVNPGTLDPGQRPPGTPGNRKPVSLIKTSPVFERPLEKP